MGQSNGIILTTSLYDKGTSILNATGTSRGVAHMPNTTSRDGETGARVMKNLSHFAHTNIMDNLSMVIIDGNPSTFLSPML
jgi:hypothetical protein